MQHTVNIHAASKMSNFERNGFENRIQTQEYRSNGSGRSRTRWNSNTESIPIDSRDVGRIIGETERSKLIEIGVSKVTER